jgi:hypothetical protein
MVRIVHGFYKEKSAFQLRRVPLQESHLPTAGPPYCPTTWEKSGIKMKVFSGSLKKGFSKEKNRIINKTNKNDMYNIIK